jgi:hypothetical protein
VGSAAVGRFGEVAGVGEEDCFGAVVEDVGKELGWMRVTSFGKGSRDGNGDRGATGTARGGGGRGAQVGWWERSRDAHRCKLTDDGVVSCPCAIGGRRECVDA